MLEMFQQPFMQMALAAITLTGLSCGYLSVYVVLKRLVFLTITLAQLASAAVVVASLFHIDPMLAALVGVLIGGLAFSWPGMARYLPRENALGTAYALASAAGVLLVAKNAMAEEHLMGLLYGDVLTVRPIEVWVMIAVVVVVGALHLIFRKEFLLTSFDPEMAQTLGVRARLWDVIFFVSLGLIIALAIRLAGVMLVFALLVLPGYAALLTRCRIVPATLWATILAMLAGAAGLVVSYRLDLPTSATIIAGLGAAVVAAAVVGRIREFASAVPRDAHITGHRARVALAWGALAVGLAIAVGGVAVLCMPRTPQAHASVMAVVPPSAVAPTPPETTAPAPTPEPASAPAPGVKEPVVPEAVRDVPRPVAPPPPPPPPPPSTALSAGAAKGASADLLQAIDLGDTTKVRALLKADPSLAKTRGEKGSTPLHWLAKSATVQAGAAADIAEQLIAAGAEVDARTEQGETPLLTAAWSSANKGALVVATALLAHRADVNAKDKDGNTPLSAALAPEFCTLLTEHGAKE